MKEFIEDLIAIFPQDRDIKTAKTAVSTLTYANPKSLIKVWNQYVCKYNEEIENVDLDYFINKNYDEDLKKSSNYNKANSIIEKLRQPIRGLDEDNKEKAMKYIQNLNKLCILYFSQ